MTVVNNKAGSGQDNAEGAATGDQTVPFTRFKQVNDDKKSLETENASLKAQLAKKSGDEGSVGLSGEAPKPAADQNQPVTYTRAQLSTAVEKGTITEAEANQIFDNQTQLQTASAVENLVETTMAKTDQQKRTSAKIARYTAVKPEVAMENTDIKRKVASKFAELVLDGHASVKGQGGRRTELLALELTLGNIDTLEAANKGTQDRDTHQDVGGSGSGDGDDALDGAPKDLTAKQKAFYGPKIGTIYKDWDEVKDELKFENKGLTARMAAGR